MEDRVGSDRMRQANDRGVTLQLDTGDPMTILVDTALAEFVERRCTSPAGVQNKKVDISSVESIGY